MGHNKYIHEAVKKLIVHASNVRQISIGLNIPRSTVGYTLKVL